MDNLNSSSERRRFIRPPTDLSLTKWSEKRRSFNREPFTGLYNQSYLKEYINYLDTYKPNLPLTAIFIDLDSFKKINDAYGHPVGDDCIKKAVSILKKTFRTDSEDLLFRYGGDGFLVLATPPEDESELEEFYDTIRQRLVQNLRVSNQDESLPPLSLSIGFASKKTTDSSFLDLIKRADENMYHDKKNVHSLSTLCFTKNY